MSFKIIAMFWFWIGLIALTILLLVSVSLALKYHFNYLAIKKHMKNPEPDNGIGFVIDRKNKEVLPTKPQIKVPFE